MSANVVSVVCDNGDVLCECCVVADSPLARMRGLLGRGSLPSEEGVLLRPAGSVHTAFMRFGIDVVFLDGELRVLRVASAVRPWRAVAHRRARAVLELAAGEAGKRGLEPGTSLALRQVPALAR